MSSDLNDLEKKIEQAREKKAEFRAADEGEKRGMRAGSEFLAAVCGFSIMGYGIDRYFGTAPWAMIIMIISGFIAGVYTANKTMNRL